MPGKPLEHAPIFDDLAEASAVASIILEPSWLDELDIDSGDFFNEDFSRLFQAMLSLRQRGEHIDEISLNREVSGKVEQWVIPKIISELPTHLDCAHYASIVKELSRKRQLLLIADKIKHIVTETDMSAQEATDQIRSALDTLKLPSQSSRSIVFSNPRILTSEPPTYLINVATTNQKKAVDIRFTSTELDNSTAFKRKIRERLHINPLLPRGFDALVHSLVIQGRVQFAPKDATADESVCFGIREWFKTAIEAEHREDLSQGYVEREGAYWFQSTRMIKYLSEKGRIKLAPSSFWAIIQGRGGRRSKVFRIGESTVRLWGLDKKFFEAEEEEPVEGEQIPLTEEKAKETPKGGEGDLSWLEE